VSELSRGTREHLRDRPIADVYRLRTRMTLVQHSEAMMAEKQEHCRLQFPVMLPPLLTLLTDGKVLGAFQTAMRLLAAP
jgi:hypothetical protein